MNNTKLLLSVLLCAGLLACSPAEKSIAPAEKANTMAVEPTVSPCHLTMGFDAWEPYQYVTVGNAVTGLDIELVQAITSQLACSLTIEQGTWPELLARLKEGKIDFVLGASVTPERQQFAYFSEPYRQEQFLLYVREDQTDFPYEDIKGFIAKGNRLGVVNEYYYGDEVAALYEDERYQDKFIGAIISEMNMARLVDGEIEGLLEDSFVGASILRRKGLDRYIKPHKVSLASSDVFVMFSKLSVEEQQVKAFNKALQQLKDSGEYTLIVKKYTN